MHRHRHIIAAASTLLLGCAGIDAEVMQPAAPQPLDWQTCVEDALRKGPAAEALTGALEHFGAECELGELASCSALGVMYELGLTVPKNEPRAVSLYQSACSGGNDAGCTNLARAYVNGIGVQAEPDRAVGILSHSCFSNHAPACGELGKLYLRGIGVPRDMTHAWGLLQRACAKDHAPSCFELGQLRERGELPRDTLRLISLYERACVGGIDSGCSRLDAIYASSGPMVPAPACDSASCEGARARWTSTPDPVVP